MAMMVVQELPQSHRAPHSVTQSAYAANHNNQLPPNALVKAIIINSADDVYKRARLFSGFGNVSTNRAVNDMIASSYFSGTVGQNETKVFLSPFRLMRRT